MVLFVLAQDSQNYFTGSQLPFLRNSHNPVCNEDTSPQIALADVDGHTPRVVWGFICTIDATRKPDVSAGYTILFHYSFPLVLRMVLSVLGKQSSQKAASRCLQQLTVCASAPGDRSESVPRLCKLFILPLRSRSNERGHCHGRCCLLHR